MPPRMKTRSAGQSTTTPRGGRIGGRTGRGGGRTREPTGGLGGRTGYQDGQGGDRANGGIHEVPDFFTGDVRNVSMSNGRSRCSYKEFLACSPKDNDGKGGTIMYTRWIKKMESGHDMCGCEDNQKGQKYTVGSFIGKALTWWNTQVQTRGQDAAVGMTWEDFKALMCHTPTMAETHE
nr:hypothetical protein [Tanacetum cinerariifolium]